MRDGFFLMLSNRTIAGLVADLEYDQKLGCKLDKLQRDLLEGGREYLEDIAGAEQLIAEHQELEAGA